MTVAIRTLFLFALSLVFSITAPAFADSDHHYHRHDQYFLAPDITVSGTTVNGVDVASGKLNRSGSDLTSSTLNFSRVYSASGLPVNTLGDWNHNYSSYCLVGFLTMIGGG